MSMNTDKHGFTLVELLTSMAIILMLFCLVWGITDKLVANSQNGKCLNNLRQLYIASIAFAQDNDNCFPQVYYGYETAITSTTNSKGRSTFSGGGIASYIYPERANWPASKQNDYRGTVFQDPAARPKWIKYQNYDHTTVKLYLGRLSAEKPDPLGVQYGRNNDMGLGNAPRKFINLSHPSQFLLYICGSGWNIDPEDLWGGGSGDVNIAPRHSGGFNMIFADGHALSTSSKLGDPQFATLVR